MHKIGKDESSQFNSEKTNSTPQELEEDNKKGKKYKTKTIYDTLTIKEKYEIERCNRIYNSTDMKYFHLLSNTNLLKNKIRKYFKKDGTKQIEIIKLKMIPYFLKEIEKEAKYFGFNNSSDFLYQQRIIEMKKKYKILKKMKKEYLSNPKYRDSINNKLKDSDNINLNLSTAVRGVELDNINELERISYQRKQLINESVIFKGVEIIDYNKNSNEFISPQFGNFKPYMLGNLNNASKYDLDNIGIPKYPFQIPFFKPIIKKDDLPPNFLIEKADLKSISLDIQKQKQSSTNYRPFKSPLINNGEFRPKTTPYTQKTKNNNNIIDIISINKDSIIPNQLEKEVFSPISNINTLTPSQNISAYDTINQENLTTRFSDFYNQLNYETKLSHPTENYEPSQPPLLIFNIEDFKPQITNIHFHRTINKLFNRNYLRPTSGIDLCNNFHEWRRNLRILLKSLDEVLFYKEKAISEQINNWIQVLEVSMEEWAAFNRKQNIIKCSPRNKFQNFRGRNLNPELSILKQGPLKISYVINMVHKLRPFLFINYNDELLDGIKWLYKLLFKFYEVYQTMNLYYKESFEIDLDLEYRRD